MNDIRHHSNHFLWVQDTTDPMRLELGFKGTVKFPIYIFFSEIWNVAYCRKNISVITSVLHQLHHFVVNGLQFRTYKGGHTAPPPVHRAQLDRGRQKVGSIQYKERPAYREKLRDGSNNQVGTDIFKMWLAGIENTLILSLLSLL